MLEAGETIRLTNTIPLTSRWRRAPAFIGTTTKRFVARAKGLTANSFMVSCLVATLLIAAGFGAFYMAWRGAAATLVVAVQIPYLISGGFTGIALLATGTGILSIQTTRRFTAKEDSDLDQVIDKALAVLVEVQKSGGKP